MAWNGGSRLVHGGELGYAARRRERPRLSRGRVQPLQYRRPGKHDIRDFDDWWEQLPDWRHQASFTSVDASQSSGSSTVALPIDLSGADSVDNAGATLVLSGVVSGSAGIIKNGPGTLDLTAANTFTGPTTLNAGTLLVDGAEADSPVTADSGTTLGGVGTVGSITTGGATLSPGDGAAGVLVDTGALNLGQDSSSDNSTYSVVLDGSNPGNGVDFYGQTQVAGSIALNSATLDVTLGPDFSAVGPGLVHDHRQHRLVGRCRHIQWAGSGVDDGRFRCDFRDQL